MTIIVLNTHKKWKPKTCLVEVIAFEKWLNSSEEQKQMFVKTLLFHLGENVDSAL